MEDPPNSLFEDKDAKIIRFGTKINNDGEAERNYLK